MKPYIRFVGVLYEFGVLYCGPPDLDGISSAVVFKSFEFHCYEIIHEIFLYPLKETIGFLLNLPLKGTTFPYDPSFYKEGLEGRYKQIEKKKTSGSFI